MPVGPRTSLALGLVLALTPALRAQDPRPADASGVAALIGRLSSPRFEEREAATRALAALGPAALGPLRQAARGGEAEARHRARLLVRQIERQAEADRLLAPTRLRLRYQDTPLPEAVADLGRQLGVAVTLDGDQAKFAERRVTLDTGQAPLWEALDTFCHAAGVTESFVLTPAGAAGRLAYDADERRVYAVNDSGTASQEEHLTLKDGTPPALPTCLAGALRLRALPPAVVPAQARPAGVVTLLLEVSLEHRLSLRNVLALKVDRAVDDEGRVFAQPAAAVGEAGALPGNAGEEVAILWDGVAELPFDRRVHAAAIPVRLRGAGRPSQRLRELRGTLALQVQQAPEALVTVAGVLQAAGRSVEGVDGNAVKVVEARRADDGEVHVRVEVSPSPELLVGSSPARLILITEGRWRGRGTPVPPPVRAEQLRLLDARGRAFPRTDSTTPAVNGTGTAWEIGLVYKPGPDQGPPARLVYTGYRTFTVTVPFTLHDVPLP